MQFGVASFQFDNQKNVAKWVIDPDDPAAIASRHDQKRAAASVGDASASLLMDAKIVDDKFNVHITLIGKLNPDDDNLCHVVEFDVAEGATVDVPEFVLDSGGPFNDRAYFRSLKIVNLPAQAI